jgi:hypothetical protein
LLSNAISIYPISSKPFGLTYAEWSVKWWQWLLSIPKPNNPAFDSSGLYARVSQSDPNVFFLCQTIEGVGLIPSRTTSVPAGQAIFMPVINWISTMNIDGKNEPQLLSVAKEKMDVISDLEIVVNDAKIKEPVNHYRAHSSLFLAELPDNNILCLPPGKRQFVSDGYWICFQPRMKNIKISSFGSCSAGITKIGINYNLYIK